MKIDKALAVFAVYLLGLSALRADTRDGRIPSFRAVLFTPGPKVDIGSPLPLVVEIENLGKLGVKINNDLLVVKNPRPEDLPTTKPVQNIKKHQQDLFPPKGAGLFITFEIREPAGPVQSMELNGQFTRHITAVSAGEDALLKFVLPPGSLEVGDCLIRVVLRSGSDVEAVSASVPIEGLHEKPKATTIP